MKIYRKRYIPNEIVDISEDEVLYKDKKLIITKWLPINPRSDMASGMSYTMLDKGWKLSKFFDKEGKLLYWYCDIIDYDLKQEEGEEVYTLIDLLLDVKVYEDGSYEVLDEEELEEAFQTGLVTKEQKEKSKKRVRELIQIIESGEFPPIQNINY